MRKCGDCQLCCKLVPVAHNMPGNALHKAAGERCPHQRRGKGCAIYTNRPVCCALWNCRWLINDDAGDLPRPDRCGYVIDVVPDFAHLRSNDGATDFHQPVVQVWATPAVYRDLPNDPKLRAWAERKGTALLIRLNNESTIFVAPPCVTGRKDWFIKDSSVTDQQPRTPAEIAELSAKWGEPK